MHTLRIRTACALLLALPLLGSGVNAVVEFAPLPVGTGHVGEELFALLDSSGLAPWLALGHVVLGVLLLIPRWRFAAGLLQLPVTLGIVVFNLVLFPPGIPLALMMLVLNLGVLADRRRLGLLLMPVLAPPPHAAAPPLTPTERAH